MLMWNWGKKVDIVEIMGGLGNQMFQYAYALYLQHYRHSTHRVEIDISTTMSHYTKHNGWEIARVFDCQLPIIEEHLLGRIKKERVYFPIYRRFMELREGYYYPIDYRGVCKYRHHTGYWQNEGYLIPIEQQVREAFTFPQELLSSETISIAEQIEKGLSVSIHVRRGDYIEDPQAAVVHGNICSERYYKEAISFLQNKLETPIHFYIFSDDPQWVEQTFDLPIQTIVSHNKGADNWQDMYLMSRCQHHIIANSSFSWWGAWLNTYVAKSVLAPSQWFHNREVDIVPKSWIQITTGP